MRVLFTALRRMAFILVAAVGMAQTAGAATYDLRTAVFEVPSDWKLTYSQRDQEADFESPDGRYQVWMRWWFPDEPLLGYDDIKRHQSMTLAGQEALFIHTESGGQRMLQMAFLEKDAEGEIFLVQVIGTGVPLDQHETVLRDFLNGLTLKGVPVRSPTRETPAATPPTAPSHSENGSLAGMYRDSDAGFALPRPDGWSVQTTTSAGMQQVLMIPPSRDALVLVAVARPDRGMSAAAVLDDYMGVLYRDSLIVKSIENERYPQIAGASVHAIETVAKVYAINGVALPYPRGRVWIYRSEDASAGRAPFLILTIRPEAPGNEISTTLDRIAQGFTYDLAATGSPPARGETGSTPEKGPGPAPDAAAPALAGLLFDGNSLSGLLPFAFNSVQFDTHARLTGNQIEYAFPDGHGWAKLGFATQTATVQMPVRDSDQTQRITAIIDADRSSGISFALSSPDNATKDPWEVNDLRFQLSTEGDGMGLLQITQRAPRTNLDARFRWPKGETVLHLLLRPDHVIELRDGTGTQLAEVALPGDLAGRAWSLQTYLQVHRKSRAGSLVLKRLSVDTIPFVRSPKVDAIATTGRPAVIFDGYALGRIWTGVSRYKKQFAQFSTLADGQLSIRWNADDEGSWTGIATPEAVLFLDRFTGAAEARIDLALDGAASKDFELSLLNRYGLPGNLSGSGAYILRFTQDTDGTFKALSALRGREKQGLRTVGLTAIPDHVSVLLTPQGVRVIGAGLPTGTLPYPEAQDGIGFRLAIHAMPTANKDGALVLRGVRVAMRPGLPQEPPQPLTGVDPLPHRVLFDTRPDADWRGVSFGNAEFTTLSRQGSDGLTLTRRTPPPDWNRIALVGSKVLADLDYRVATTPYDLTVQLTPSAGLGTRIYLHDNPDRFEDKAISILTLRELTDGPEVGGLEVRLHTGHFSYDHWRRVLPAGAWQRDWDGTVRLRLGPDWIAVALGDDWLMRGHRRGQQLMMAITPGGAAKQDSGDITLRRITGGWVTPDRLSGAERMRLTDDDTFDADAFLDQVAAESKGPAQ